MILPEDFPYITSIYVNDCYTYQNFNIDLIQHKPLSHLILTGKNGSGKSTILRSLNLHISKALTENQDGNYVLSDSMKIKPSYRFDFLPFFFDKRKEIVYSYLSPQRNSKVNDVSVPTKQDDFKQQLEKNYDKSSDYFINNFMQFLVNKKVAQAFAQLDNNQVEIDKINIFFQQLESSFRKIFEDEKLKITFNKDALKITFLLGDGRELSFNDLSDGISALLSIIMDLFLRVELIRDEVGNKTYNPCGIVLIDEPETHLHYSLQYNVLPILTNLFPNVQFIVASHSAAIVSSIKNVTIFDLVSKEVLSDDAIGKSFSELMVSHFGLDNEFSDFTDDLFEKVNIILKEYRNNIPLRNQQLKAILKENERYISPTMRFELEAKISE
ncbi:AAA family ATPase [Arcicella sp. LKC2W]|uniref:AAA family ATPase n=1 Tax=Arcicella sp. LKC2W TaxID=2984198 RepID=UPI002B203FD1|nr:AAA family ATPase [Arcicella sp. LKC2W]MEA5457677.1 AAA family ATPase [Arcicella sp. LKC2W]